MERRKFIEIMGAGAIACTAFPCVALAAAGSYNNLLVLIELKGANDGLNTVIPFANPAYYKLRPRLAIAPDQIVELASGTGLHPQLAMLKPLWDRNELAIVQGVGYPDQNLSHFRSIEIWDTASKSDEYLHDGWLTRAFAASSPPRKFFADGAVVGSSDMGPLSGIGVRSIALADTGIFLRQAHLSRPSGDARNAALQRILKLESEIQQAAGKLNAEYIFKTNFPPGPFGNAVRTAAELIASNAGIAVIRLSLNGFDTHSNQTATHANLLHELGGGIVALRAALIELKRWHSTLVMTYAEFGRRPQENQSGGTDHGTANAHFVVGGKVKGGLYGQTPQLDCLDGNGNLPYAVDFRSLYATVLERWWGVDSIAVLGRKLPTLDLVKT